MELFCYSNQELKDELKRRENIETQKVVYMFFDSSTKLIKNRSKNSTIVYLLPSTIFKDRSFISQSRNNHNKNLIDEYRDKGYKIVLFCPESEYDYNKNVVYYSDEVIIY